MRQWGNDIYVCGMQYNSDAKYRPRRGISITVLPIKKRPTIGLFLFFSSFPPSRSVLSYWFIEKGWRSRVVGEGGGIILVVSVVSPIAFQVQVRV